MRVASLDGDEITGQSGNRSDDHDTMKLYSDAAWKAAEDRLKDMEDEDMLVPRLQAKQLEPETLPGEDPYTVGYLMACG